MVKKHFFVIVLLSMLSLTGCATNAMVEGMRYPGPMTQPLKNKSFANNVNVNQVSGGHQTNPMWTSQIDNQDFKKAIEQSLQENGLYNQHLKGKYNVNATLIKLDQPLMGLNLTVSCEVNYKVTNFVTHKVIYDKNITANYTATFQDAAYAATRLRLANEGAARENIKVFITDLYNL